ncbi:MAG TPA: trehalase family glycosidase [Anaerolineae bacterium]
MPERAEPASPFLVRLRNRIDLAHIPFSDRLARMLVFRKGDSIFIRLAERWEKQQAAVGHYRVRPPIIANLQFTRPDGQPLPFELVTYPHKLVFETPLGIVQAAFEDAETLYFSLPAQPIGISFDVQAAEGRLDRRGATFHGFRNTACTFSSRLLQQRLAPLEGGMYHAEFVTAGGDALSGENTGMLLNISPRLGYNRSLPSGEEVLAAAERRWHDWFAAAPPVLEQFERQYYYAWWILRTGLISPRYYMTREGMAPSKIHYVGVWQWDAYFHALAYRFVDMKLAEDQLRLMLDHQLPNGMIPDAVHDEGIVTHLSLPVEADVTKPPLIAWTALKLYERSGHRDFLDEIYEPMCRWNQWWFEYNDDDGDGICQYNHPFSSGLDDSPLWDQGVPVESPDLSTYLCLQMESLAAIAHIIGEEKDAARWAGRANGLAQRMIDHFWDEEAGLFWAMRDHQPIKVRTPFSLFPLWTGRLPPAVSRRLVAHLTDPSEFWTNYPIPTVACCDPAYNPDQMWRGPSWVNINYLFIDGLERCGYADLAHELRRRTLDLVMRQDDIYEYYHPETGVRPPKAAPIFGWTSAVFIELAIRASREAEATL